jgi:hypothetical protein
MVGGRRSRAKTIDAGAAAPPTAPSIPCNEIGTVAETYGKLRINEIFKFIKISINNN